MEQSVVKFFLLIILTCLTVVQCIDYVYFKKKRNLIQAILYLIALVSVIILSFI